MSRKFIVQLVGMVCCLLTSGCSAYSSRFACPDSKGAPCLMMSEIERMVQTGEIERYHHSKKYLKNKYKYFPEEGNKELLKIKTKEVEAETEFCDEGYLYVK